MVWACQSNTQNMEAGELGDWDHLDYIVRPILKKKNYFLIAVEPDKEKSTGC